MRFFHCNTNWFIFQRIKKIIKQRAGGVSEISGRSNEPCECSHINHNRNNPNYNNPANAQYITISEHLAYHETWSPHNSLGLSREGNERAIYQLKKRLRAYYELKEKGQRELPPVDIGIFSTPQKRSVSAHSRS